MLIRAMALFCENEHGTGDVYFPPNNGDEHEAGFNPNLTAKVLRRDARKAGWKRIMAADYCPVCVASVEGRDTDE